MSAADADEDALLLEALAFIGDLDVGVDEPAGEEDVLTSLLCDDGLDFHPSAEAASMTPMLLDTGAQNHHPVNALPTELVRSDSFSPLAVSEASTSDQRRPNTFDAKLKAKNLSRSRTRDELLYLRGLVGDLEKRLTSLRPIPGDESTVSPTESNELVEAWAQLATRQYQQRQESEMENIRLKRLLQDQIKLGRSFERLLLKKRPTVESLDANFESSKRLRRTSSWSWKSGLEFDELFACCASQYADTSRILAKFADEMPLIGHRDVGLVHDPDLGLTVEIKERHILPFSYEDTASEIWGFHPSDSPAYSSHGYYDVDQTDDTMKVRIGVSADVKGTRGEFSVTMVTRRYVEAHRTVMVWSGIAQPSEIGNIKMEGVRIRFSAWIVLEPLESRNATKLTAFDFSVPEADDDLRDQSRKVGTLTDFLLSTVAIERDYRSQQWENRLFRRAFTHGQ